MIIDLILDRRDGEPYNPKRFYNDVMKYGVIGHGIADAMDNGNEFDVKQAIIKYMIDCEYNKDIAEYVASVNWLD